MVAHFKVNAGAAPVHKITRDNVESLLGRRPPWFRQGQERDDDRHYAVCPYCENAVQLKGVYRRDDNSKQPYGSHVGKPLDGFPFDEVDLVFCPFRLKRKAHGRTSRRPMSEAAIRLISLAVSEFDRIVLILRDDFGFSFSNNFAERMLNQWFDSKGYLYNGAHVRNLPWMIAYFGPSQSLFGQPVAQNEELATAILQNVPQAGFSDTGRLEKGLGWYRLDLQCLHHKINIQIDEGTLTEGLTLRVQDFSNSNDASEAPLVYQKQVDFEPERFEALMCTQKHRAKRNEQLLKIARETATRWGYKHVADGY